MWLCTLPLLSSSHAIHVSMLAWASVHMCVHVRVHVCMCVCMCVCVCARARAYDVVVHTRACTNLHVC